MKVAITGATGFVGSRLVELLNAEGHQLLVLTRNPTAAQKILPNLVPNAEIIAYTPTESGSWQQAIAGCDAVVNLAGEPIAEERWTLERKQEILQSRQLGTQKIVEAIAVANPKPSVLINASAIGYYGTSESATFAEISPPGNDFLAQVFQLSRNTINLWLKRQAETGDYQAKSNRPQRTGNKITDWDKFTEFAQTHGHKTQAEMAALWEGDISSRTISRALQKIDWSRKKRRMAIENGMKPNVPPS